MDAGPYLSADDRGSAVINGVVAVPIMAAMMLVAGRLSSMGKFTATRPLLFLGWAATLIMAAAAIAMIFV
ncbi:MAG: divalent metal cation transporter [Sphingomonadales bacterium]|nr:divalent metal cation transporter [Sphingomonadales bacterium]